MQQGNKTKFYETKEFETLNTEWKAKLKDSGFNDIEEGLAEHEVRTSEGRPYHTSNRFKTREATEAYYSCIADFVNLGEFKSEIEKQIITLHADGQSIADIVKLTKKVRSTVNYHLNSVRKRIGLSHGKY